MDTPTTFQEVYDKFLSKVNDDDWSNPEDLELYEEDWETFLTTAVGMFKFPRFNVNLDHENKQFAGQLTVEEINILANLMKQEWLDRNIMTWDQIKTMYDERDFSQANMLRQLINAHNMVSDQNYHLQKIYSRSILGKDGKKNPYNYKIFGGSK